MILKEKLFELDSFQQRVSCAIIYNRWSSYSSGFHYRSCPIAVISVSLLWLKVVRFKGIANKENISDLLRILKQMQMILAKVPDVKRTLEKMEKTEGPSNKLLMLAEEHKDNI
ncbi:hypothetical protein AVEN_211468-1 [Araneus ventricosus]|uniref:Uncharacterized protein n=1 Tax=Araneus ventricosus TaxID=182803 RepID=A0A4Y2PCE8_ARAVE|nr:hypothetical protein AVEN_211468-1 [Araneus ventricosus]